MSDEKHSFFKVFLYQKTVQLIHVYCIRKFYKVDTFNRDVLIMTLGLFPNSYKNYLAGYTSINCTSKSTR